MFLLNSIIPAILTLLLVTSWDAELYFIKSFKIKAFFRKIITSSSL